MSSENKDLKITGWRYKIHETTFKDVIGKYKHNNQFDKNIINMFDFLAKSCKLLWNRANAIHIFINYNFVLREMHYRNISHDKALSYKKYEFEKIKDIENFTNLLRGNKDRSSENSDLLFVRILETDIKEALINSPHFQNIIDNKDCLNESDPIVLIFDIGDANLGCILLYGNERNTDHSMPFSNDESSKSAINNWAKAISQFFRQHSGVTAETYLPSYRNRHSTPAAIMFGDITNFTQLATMLRIIQVNNGQSKIEKLGDIMQEHCSSMSSIVSEHKGRIERFVGDGLMAIFGEHGESPVLIIGDVFASAIEMVKKFRENRNKIQKIIYGDNGQNEINEMVELDYSIGINYGTVLFDYLGDDQHLEYSCIGDQVAFADRLMHKGARFDLTTNDTWPPILISQTTEQHLKFWFNKQDWERIINKARRVMHTKGYGYPSYVFAFDIEMPEFLKLYEKYRGPISNYSIEQIVIELKKENKWDN